MKIHCKHNFEILFHVMFSFYIIVLVEFNRTIIVVLFLKNKKVLEFISY